MDAMLYYDHYDPIPAPWWRCCGCARSDTPISGCQCVCHEAAPYYDDEDFGFGDGDDPLTDMEAA